MPDALVQWREKPMAGRSEERHRCMWEARMGRAREELKEAREQTAVRNTQAPRMLWLERN